MASPARDVALEVLRRVSTQSAFASHALRSALAQRPQLSPVDRALATELVYGVLRHRGQLDRTLGGSGRRLKDLDPRLHDVLRLAAYQLVFLDRVPEHAAVSEAVDQAKARTAGRGGGLANAILRRLAERPRGQRLPAPTPLETDPVRHVAEAGSLPHPLAELLVRDLGATGAARFALASLQPGRLCLRVNLLRASRDALAAEVGGEPGGHPLAVKLAPRAGVLPAELPAVREGRATPQDEASMRVVDLLEPQPGERVLDVCAAPGGKTTYIAERMRDQGEVLAFDRLPERLRQVGEHARRLGLASVQPLELLPDLSDRPFDRVLVDAPCSGLGTLRRHPEIRWRFTPADLEGLLRVQAQVLEEGARRVRPGGVLVYSVCTVTRAECGPPPPPGFELEAELRTTPDEEHQPDGFYAARWRRRPCSPC